MSDDLRDESAALAARIRDEAVPEDAWLQIRQYGGGLDESYLEATRQGLLLLAARLLRIAAEAGDSTVHQCGDVARGWDDGDVGIDYVEVHANVSDAGDLNPPEGVWKGRALGIGCIATLLALFASAVVGMGTIAVWLFG